MVLDREVYRYHSRCTVGIASFVIQCWAYSTLTWRLRHVPSDFLKNPLQPKPERCMLYGHGSCVHREGKRRKSSSSTPPTCKNLTAYLSTPSRTPLLSLPEELVGTARWFGFSSPSRPPIPLRLSPIRKLSYSSLCPLSHQPMTRPSLLR